MLPIFGIALTLVAFCAMRVFYSVKAPDEWTAEYGWFSLGGLMLAVGALGIRDSPANSFDFEFFRWYAAIGFTMSSVAFGFILDAEKRGKENGRPHP